MPHKAARLTFMSLQSESTIQSFMRCRYLLSPQDMVAYFEIEHLSRRFAKTFEDTRDIKRRMQTCISCPESLGDLYFSFDLILSISVSMYEQASIIHAVSNP